MVSLSINFVYKIPQVVANNKKEAPYPDKNTIKNSDDIHTSSFITNSLILLF